MHAEQSHRSRPIEYPESDGQPMADNTLQFEWISILKWNLDSMLEDFVAGDLLWYPVEGQPKNRMAPDVMVALGRPKGHRGSYLQWKEDGVAPQVVFEILSPKNTVAEMIKKARFYERYGVEEFYMYDPMRNTLDAWIRSEGTFEDFDALADHTSARLGVRFVVDDEALRVFDRSGEPFLTFDEVKGRAAAEQRRADVAEQRAATEAERAATEAERAAAEAGRAALERTRAEAAEQKAVAEAERAALERARADAAERRAEALAARLRAAGIEPD